MKTFSISSPSVDPTLTKRGCTHAFWILLDLCASLSTLGWSSGSSCVPQDTGKRRNSFFTSVSFHLSPEVMTALICSQAINSCTLSEPFLSSARSSEAHIYQLIILSPSLSFCWLSDDDCTNSFTPNQVARMHCYLDLVYQSWQPAKKPAPIAIAPQIVVRTSTSITLEWFPPIDGHFFERWSWVIICSRSLVLSKGANSGKHLNTCLSSFMIRDAFLIRARLSSLLIYLFHFHKFLCSLTRL